MKPHNNKLTRSADFQERRENAMRPSRYLGYDHDRLGMYLMERQAYTIAEAELRRAVWLNPFEPAFVEHLAMCLCKQQRFDEACVILDQNSHSRSSSE